ncbi:MAG: thioesterase family protein [Actinomycetota bacterium]|nr:thioesterase family protein [Actinomycetota bacterium]
MSDHSFDLADRATFTHWVTDRIRFSDTDAQGHVNNVAIAAYVETGRLMFGHDIVRDLPSANGTVDSGNGDGGRTAAADDDPTEESGAVLAHLSIDFRQELFFPGTIDIGNRVVRIGRSSYMVGTGVFCAERCIATATGVIVTMRAGRPSPIPPETRARLTELLTT